MRGEAEQGHKSCTCSLESQSPKSREPKGNSNVVQPKANLQTLFEPYGALLVGHELQDGGSGFLASKGGP